jgi:hypothetical protein
MRRFFGSIFIFFAVITFFGGFVDPELGVGGGIFGCLFWGIPGYFLMKKKKTEAVQKQVEPVPLETAAPMTEFELEDLEESLSVAPPVPTIRFACKSCGAKNESPSVGSNLRCEYCGSPSVPPIPDA